MISDEYISWLNDKILMKYSRNSAKKHSRETCLEYLVSFEDTRNLFFGIFETSTDSLVGTLTVHVDAENKSGDIGILVGRPSAQSRGFGSKAWGLAIAYLFEIAGVEEVTAGTDYRNFAMVRVIECNDMKFLETVTGDLLDDPQSRVLRYKLTKQQWIAHKTRQSSGANAPEERKS
jgi:RimJ/RimL family protein N-acetyltransferase